MIFDFGRCIYEPIAWQFLAYYKGEHKTKEQYEKELKETKKALCNQYAILEMRFINEKVSIYLFDEDIKKFINAIRDSHKRGDNYVFANIDKFEDETDDLKFHANANTWEQNIYN